MTLNDFIIIFLYKYELSNRTVHLFIEYYSVNMKFCFDNITIIQCWHDSDRKFNTPVHMTWFLSVVLHLVLRLNQFNCVKASESLHTTSYTHTHTHFSLPHYSQASVTNPALSPVVRSFSAGLYFSLPLFLFFSTHSLAQLSHERNVKEGKT